METKIYIDYEMIFADKPLAIFDYLKNIDRHNLICVAIRLIYSDDLFSDFKDYCAEFFCAENFNFANECYHLLNERIQEDNKDTTSIIPRKYIITSQTAALELLRQTFAINIGDFVSNTPQVLQEQYLFKAILLINKLIGHWEAPLEYDSKGAITNLCLAKSILCTTLNDFDSSNLKAEYIAMLQIIKGYHFFRYCEHSKLREHLSIFLENNGAKSWQHYLYDAIQLILFPLQNKHGNFPRIILNNQRDGEKFLRVHSFKEDTIVSLENNMDYTYFKSHPLIELNDGTYLPISPLFCINHIYKSIYFEFKAINESFVGTSTYLKGQGLLSIFTTEFSEQTLFEYYTRNALYRHNGLKLSDKDCKLIIDVGHEPDFYCRDGNNIMLFENKDIKIPDKVISSKQYDLLESELHKKLITNKGVSQLIYNIKQIERNTFKWDSSIPNNPRIYPILVIDDSSLCAPGLNYILRSDLNLCISIKILSNSVQIELFIILWVTKLIHNKQPMYAVLDKDTIKNEILPHLSVAKRGFQSKSSLIEVINAILYKLKTGCQWEYLPVKELFSGKVLKYGAVFHHYNKWSKKGEWKSLWLQLLDKHRSELDMSSVDLDGSHTPAIRGGEEVGYQGRKKRKTTNALYLTDRKGLPLAMSVPKSGEHHDTHNIVAVMQNMMEDMAKANIRTDGLFLNADAGFDCAALRSVLKSYGIVSNICINKRNGTTNDSIVLDELLYRERYSIERTNAWMDSFRTILNRFDTTLRNWESWNYIAFSVMLLRKCARKRKV